MESDIVKNKSLFDEYLLQLEKKGIKIIERDGSRYYQGYKILCEVIESKINEAKKEILDKVLGKGYQWDIAKDI